MRTGHDFNFFPLAYEQGWRQSLLVGNFEIEVFWGSSILVCGNQVKKVISRYQQMVPVSSKHQDFHETSFVCTKQEELSSSFVDS